MRVSQRRALSLSVFSVFGSAHEPLAQSNGQADHRGHSINEQREIIIGHYGRLRLLVVSFSAREDTVRIFSARRATRQERRDYEENVES
ncbi:MAG: BrnT family toxin [Acidobacteria bacterium]|nr:BrnT family toxin [Acidobacteriota bacterium]